MSENDFHMAATYPRKQSKGLPTSIWLVIVAMAVLITVSVSMGVAYSGISRARTAAAKANLGYIESTLRLAEISAEENGFGPPPESYEGTLRSYEGNRGLGEYERFILAYMIDALGKDRDFDFAVNKFTNASGNHVQIYYFPTRGRVDTKIDKFYVWQDGKFPENNI